MLKNLSIPMVMLFGLTVLSACDAGKDRADALKQQAAGKADQIRESTEQQSDALKEKASNLLEQGEKKAELTEKQGEIQANAVKEQRDLEKEKSATLRSERQGEAGVAGLDKDDVERYQRQLKNTGHLKGKVDGIFGVQTRAALRNFQSEQNLETTGQFDSETRDKLSQQAGTSGK